MSATIPPPFNGAECVLQTPTIFDLSAQINYTIPKSSLYKWCCVDAVAVNFDAVGAAEIDTIFNNDTGNKYSWCEDLNIAGTRTNPTQLAQTNAIKNTNFMGQLAASGRTLIRTLFTIQQNSNFITFTQETIAAGSFALPRHSLISGMYQQSAPITQIGFRCPAVVSVEFYISVMLWGK